MPLVVKTTLIWLVCAILAIANGVIRESVLSPLLGPAVALPVSGLVLSALVLLVTYLFGRHFVNRSPVVCWLVGLQWVAMTLLFEFGLGYFVAGLSWSEMLRTFDVLTGNLFAVVLVTALVAPALVNRLRRSRN